MTDARSSILGRQRIPSFVEEATLHRALSPVTPSGLVLWQNTYGRFDVACLAFFDKGGDHIHGGGIEPLSLSFWSMSSGGSGGHRFHAYGSDCVKVPGRAEFFSLAFMAPPRAFVEDAYTGFPEDFFSVTWGLSI